MKYDSQMDALAFAERMLVLLDQGKATSTYKYAVLLSLMDLVLEQTDRHGNPPQFVTTRQLAEKTIALYWPQTNQFLDAGKVLLQNKGNQATILQDILSFRSQRKIGESAPLHAAKSMDKEGFHHLMDQVEWVLIRYPLPLLQVFGEKRNDFIYSISWDNRITQGAVTRYQKSRSTDFDNRIMFREGVPEHLLRLNTLLRPLIQREWTHLVARRNHQPEATLEDFLFNPSRTWVARAGRPLLQLQDGYCFYCHERIKGGPEVDHFIPWSRQPNDGLANLVVADGKCNRMKKDFLAASEHLDHWLKRIDGTAGTLDSLRAIAADSRWDLGLESSLGVASSIYLRLRPEMILWKEKDQFEPVEESTLRLLSDLFSRSRIA